MSKGNWGLAQDLEQAFNLVGESMMKPEFAAQLLAFTYVIGGEATVLSESMNAGIAIASQKFNIKGGEVPKAEYMFLLKSKILQMEIAIAGFKCNKETVTMKELTKVLPWLQGIWDRYNIHPDKQTTTVKNHTTK
jgi:ABC-type amino acid transport system permease subunit